ncbi:bacillithiol system redox-active protein YtxJ [Zhouia sp. PK063]|uniref:bacillithiol system redox-active protein YtxJ n=1 Tax=Zhouia sp. PK063 TaxID=3373602 RepID=UPI0037AF87FA
MGFFDKIFGEKEVTEANKTSIPWIEISSVNDLDEIVAASNQKTVAIFKHSTRCGISRMVLKSFESEFDLNDANISMYFLDLLQHRAISNEIAERFNVYHESPQLLIIKNGNVVFHTSHGQIEASLLEKYI